MSYISKELIFSDKSIYFIGNNGFKFHVMMDWEKSIMKHHADCVCSNKGDILEIGFGMGISAGYIQENNPKSHTIIESHPQVIPRALDWAKDKDNVTIVQGDWYDKYSDLSTYDGIFYDAYCDSNMYELQNIIPSLINKGGIFTWWNINKEKNSKGFIDFENIEWHSVDIEVDDNDYFNNNVYHMPMKQF
jgi:tRNA A58 N-methylase Trm61